MRCDAADVLSDVTKDLLNRHDGGRVGRLSLWCNHRASVEQERRFLPLATEVWATTETEADRFRSLVSPVKVIAVPSSLDETAVAAVPAATGSTIGFLGTCSYLPNLEALVHLADEVLPFVVASRAT
jgi:hypothetical protein